MKSLIVNINKDKIRLDTYIKKCFNIPSSTIYKALRNKDIRVNSIKVNENIYVSNNDKIDIYIKDDILFGLNRKIKYYYEDDNILVAYKPKKVVSCNSCDNNDFEKMVCTDKGLELYICHRLDTNTSGLVIFAKSIKVLEEIKKLFKLKCVNKYYIAYVFNYKFLKKHDILKHYLVKDSLTSYVKIYDNKKSNSCEIITEYTVLETNKKLNYAKLEVKLHTGKTHQIRAHLAYIKHPIIGDSKYSTNEINKQFKTYTQSLEAYKYTFNILHDSFLNYLNNIEIKTT